ncbi:MAG: hypothetical protein WCG66_12390, partial [bacterium]
MRGLSSLIPKLCFLVEFTALAVAADAVETTWNRVAGNGNWTDSLNWSQGAPTAGAKAVFAGNVPESPSNPLRISQASKAT